MINVTCAIIRNEDEEILVVQRGEKSDHPFKWEFPGGKTNPGESDEECIIREIREELSMDIVICSSLQPVEHDYGHKKIRLIPFVCDTLDELPVLSEHIAYRWITVTELRKLDLCEADAIISGYITGPETGNAEASLLVNRIDEGEKDENLDEQLKELLNNIMTSREANWISDSALENPFIFRKLLEYSLSDDKKLAFRASWSLTKVCDKFPEIIIPHLPAIIDTLPVIDNESVERSFLRILSLTEMGGINEKRQGFLADFCFTKLNSAQSSIAIKAYCMEILYNLSVIYPQLGNELAVSIRSIMEEGSAGIVARGNSILRKITSIPLDPGSNLK